GRLAASLASSRPACPVRSCRLRHAAQSEALGSRRPNLSGDSRADNQGVAMSPTYGNGKICYLEIPASEVRASAAFYEAVFGWKTRKRGDGAVAFDDGVGEVSGTWVLGRPPSGKAGVLI